MPFLISSLSSSLLIPAVGNRSAYPPPRHVKCASLKQEYRRSIVCFSAVAIAIARSIIQDLHIIPDIACTSSGTNAHCAIWHNGFSLPADGIMQEGTQGGSLSDIVLSIGGLLPCFSSVHPMSFGCSDIEGN